MKEIIIGTRGSELALYQARMVAGELRDSGYEGKIVEKIIQTSGDKHKDTKLSEFSKGDKPLTDKGVFTKELEESLIRKEIDIAVHSLKDLPSDLGEDFEIGAIMKRAATSDVLISRLDSQSFGDLKKGTVIGQDDEKVINAPYEETILIMPTKRLFRGKTAVRLAYRYKD